MSNPLLILDLDETLMHVRGRELERPADFEVGPYRVYRRPGVEEFLRRAAELFDLAVWSSGGCDYVAGVVAGLFPDVNQLRFAWSSERCVQRYHPERREEYWVKDLRKIRGFGYPLSRVLVVDDTPEKLERNYGNLIRIEPYFGEPADEELPRLLAYLEWLRPHEDYRQVEKRGWRQGGGVRVKPPLDQ